MSLKILHVERVLYEGHKMTVFLHKHNLPNVLYVQSLDTADVDVTIEKTDTNPTQGTPSWTADSSSPITVKPKGIAAVFLNKTHAYVRFSVDGQVQILVGGLFPVDIVDVNEGY